MLLVLDFLFLQLRMGILCAGLCQGLYVLSSLAHLSGEGTALLLVAFFAYCLFPSFSHVCISLFVNVLMSLP